MKALDEGDKKTVILK
ncbi:MULTISPECIES: hypothetical protein [Bacillus cereus group]|nr:MULTISPECIES: hypothetical protein [Bacillus cereus group]MDA1847919.1 hypothetical protein [Bacillus cereus]MDA1851681.1 hypothetical protein [Bacillus cereus]MDC2940984.1 hypothetical protein [Bacillus thuringiensis]MDF9486221.1 hypothetical protein [Bacillus cereus]MEC0017612.1 hypothetical protein [Bacillus anthracis]